MLNNKEYISKQAKEITVTFTKIWENRTISHIKYVQFRSSNIEERPHTNIWGKNKDNKGKYLTTNIFTQLFINNRNSNALPQTNLKMSSIANL